MLTPKQRRRFKYLVKSLNELLDDVRQDYPEASYFLQSNSFMLCSDDAYGELGRGVDDPVMANETLRHVDSGDP